MAVAIDFNVDEYVGEMLACADRRLTDKELAEEIADIAMTQGHCAGEQFEDVVAALLPQMAYYR